MSDRPKPPSLAQLMPFVHSGGGLWVTNLYHYAGILVAWVAARVGMSPNGLTLTAAVLTTLGGILLLLAPTITWPIAIASFALLAVGYAMDCSDGQLARATKSGSVLGAWLDHTVDAWKIVFLNACLGWLAITQIEQSGLPLWAAYLAPHLSAGGTLLYFFGWNYKVQLAGKNTVGNQLGSSSSLKKILLLPLHLTDFGLFLFICFTLPFPKIFLITYLAFGAVTFPVFAAYLLLSAWALRKA
ncbi:MAG: CDP-alcohol phosphatidyltransferase family protein [Verrucomicrobiales bacterium]|nr:CDP-alcohol phosphatidyltransferase family protein [Verrucomicrobiales bacterium]